jgi:putative sugar O-methyltransferase
MKGSGLLGLAGRDSLRDMLGTIRSLFRSSGSLSVARAHYRNAAIDSEGLPSLGLRWNAIRRQMADAIRGFETPADAIAYGQRPGFDHRGPVTEADIPKLKITQLVLRNAYPEFREAIPQFSETPATTPGMTIEFQSDFGPRSFASHILYFHAFYILTLTRFRRVTSICEVGGGYGNPCFLWFTNPVQRVTRYVIVDLPESLFFAEVFLRAALPDVPVRYATENDPVDAAPGITLVPLSLADQTAAVPFDCIVNTGSMNEMSNEWVAHWGAWLDRQLCDLFYSNNMIGGDIDAMLEYQSTFAPVVGPLWRPACIGGMNPMMHLHADGERVYWLAEIIFQKSAKPRADITQLLDFLGDARLSYDNYILGAYALSHDPDPGHLERFARKAIADLGRTPVELLHFARHASPTPYLSALRDDLEKRLAATTHRGPGVT